MSLVVYNTLTGKKEEFSPLNPPKVGMYVCGVTVYDLCHIGHARANIVFDVIYRYLKFRGYEVTYVRNITDIDDKIIKKASELGSAWDEVAGRYTDEFHADMSALGLASPDAEPKATECIVEMIEIIRKLVDEGKAYELDGSVYFSVRDFPEYGALSKKNIEELEAGARVEVDARKRDPLDFALWKASKPGEPSWDSPWGPGRPGWHIECSAMGRKFLGVTFDIHGGGKDLVFPHHENEIAQSQGSSGLPPVRYWIHNGFVTINAEKMSKSLGNIFTIKDLLKESDPEALRLFLLSSHYRSPIDFADSYLADAHKNLGRFYEFLAFADDIAGESAGKAPEALKEKFMEHMDDDFNTAAALADLNNELRRLNQTRMERGRMKKKSDDYKKARESILDGAAGIRELGGVLGLFQRNPAEFLESAKAERLRKAGFSREKIEERIKARAEARAKKNFETADGIRAELEEKGILLHDAPGGVTTWSVKFD
ncbi:MAG: cysteine--tRNA ligase [Candidatus Nitrospinota bacterium M3_3B_026]